MSGGKSAQLAFEYQNLFSILTILKGLMQKNLIKVRVEQPVNSVTKKEIDLILTFSNEYLEYYEIKSGVAFTSHKKEIKENVIKLFNKFLGEGFSSGYFIIINREYREKVFEFICQLDKISKYKRLRRTKSFNNLCSILKLEKASHKKFYEFCKLLQIKSENDTSGVIGQITKLLENIFQDSKDPLVVNADHALSKDILIDTLIAFVKKSLRNNDGNLNLDEFIEIMVDWGARNRIAYKTAKNRDIQKMLKKERTDVANKLSSRFKSSLPIKQDADITKEYKEYESD